MKKNKKNKTIKMPVMNNTRYGILFVEQIDVIEIFEFFSTKLAMLAMEAFWGEQQSKFSKNSYFQRGLNLKPLVFYFDVFMTS